MSNPYLIEDHPDQAVNDYPDYPDQDVDDHAYQAVDQASDLDIAAGRSPISVAAAAIYMASQVISFLWYMEQNGKPGNSIPAICRANILPYMATNLQDGNTQLPCLAYEINLDR